MCGELKKEFKNKSKEERMNVGTNTWADEEMLRIFDEGLMYM